MTHYYITATRKDGLDPDHRIDAVKLEEAIWPIDAAINFVRDNPGKVLSGLGLLAATVYAPNHPRTGRPFLTTSRDGRGENNLLNLPDC